MGIIRVQHALQDDSGLPEDQYVNTWYFSCSGSPTETLSNAAAAAVNGFYTANFGGAYMPSYLSPQLSGEWIIKTYDMSDALPRIPIGEYSGTLTGIGTGTGVGLPSEVAACLSFAATPIAGVPAGRLRGRIFLGPLDSETNAGTSSNTSHIDSTFLGRMTQNAKAMAEAAAALDLTWVVYSPTRIAASPVAKCWADDAWDIQRRRGQAATLRVTELIG